MFIECDLYIYLFIFWFFVFFLFFFFKQKTAYEMCGRDWSSDVCSSDSFDIRGVNLGQVIWFWGTIALISAANTTPTGCVVKLPSRRGKWRPTRYVPEKHQHVVLLSFTWKAEAENCMMSYLFYRCHSRSALFGQRKPKLAEMSSHLSAMFG